VEWSFGGHRWHFEPGALPRLMGIVNVTPDSFSDGGRHVEQDAAVAHAHALADSGANLLDVGGESTRPGAAPVSVEVERARVLPVVERLARGGVPLSIDTSKAAVAEAALVAGAVIVNDVTALGDPRMAEVVARQGAGLILMHMRGTPRTMQQGDLSSADIVGEVRDSLAERLAYAVGAGVPREAIVLDPGIGFGKTVTQNIALLAGLRRLATLGRPLLVGLSRKSFLGVLTERTVEQREAGTTAAHALATVEGAHLLRVHDVAAARDAVRVAAAFIAARGTAP
jgi:dihydropteroate synthase